MRSDSGRRPGRDATYANILCGAAEQEPPCAPREPVPLTAIDLGMTLGATALFVDASELRAMIDCFRLVQGKNVRAGGELDVNRTLVVKGLDPTIILLSVQNSESWTACSSTSTKTTLTGSTTA